MSDNWKVFFLMYKHDIFYKTNNLSLKKKIAIINDAKKVSIDWWVDILDCSKSSMRQRIEMSYEDIMKKFNNSCHFVIIHRMHNFFGINGDKEIGEICFSTLKIIDYFLWINISIENLQKIIKKNKLIENK